MYMFLCCFTNTKVKTPVFKEKCPAKISKLVFPNFHVILPNASKYKTTLNKKIPKNETNSQIQVNKEIEQTTRMKVKFDFAVCAARND